MKLEDVNKKMPFRESPDYLDDLIQKATNRAVIRKKAEIRRRQPKFMQIAASLAILMTLSGLGWTYYDTTLAPGTRNLEPGTTDESPLDQFLSKTTDQQAQAINYYEIENIADYE